MCWMYLASVLVASFGVLVFLALKYPWLKYDFVMLWKLGRMILKSISYMRRNITLLSLLEKHAKENPEKELILFKDRRITYKETSENVNKMAAMFRDLGYKPGEDTVALMMPNCPEFVWMLYGLAKMNLSVGLLNFNLKSDRLLHCINTLGAKAIIVSDRYIELFDEISSQLSTDLTIYVHGNMESAAYKHFNPLFDAASDKDFNPGLPVRMTRPLCYIYTSGTTGFPKAAVVSELKALRGSLLMDSVGVDSTDVIYTCLPLYHSAGVLIALGSAIQNGATLALREKFSASNFWKDCKQFNVTVIQYIGEICRYLVAQPKSGGDKDHSVRAALGNGLRPDIWEEFQSRFNVPVIREFYAATENNAGLMNMDDRVGAVGRSSPLTQIVVRTIFVEFNFEEEKPYRDSNGFMKKIIPGSGVPGLLIAPLQKNYEYEGYKGNEKMTNSKILRDVFTRGDVYVNSGDLFFIDADHYVYFADRIGDTFRWKGENVSTSEVANVVSKVSWVEDTNVYGVQVKGMDGRAGMAAIKPLNNNQQVTSSHLVELYKHCADSLPSYATPRFVRILPEMPVTVTFKQQKFKLVADGFDPEKCSGDPVYCMSIKDGTYIDVTPDIYQEIVDGKIKI